MIRSALAQDFELLLFRPHIGRSVGFVSQIERGQSQPSIEDAYGISQLLGVDYLSFFEGPAAHPKNTYVVKQPERSVLNYRGDITDELLSPSVGGRFHILMTKLAPGASSGDAEIVEDDGEQGGVLMAGQMTMWIDGKRFDLEAGDSFQFPSTIPHRYENPGREEAVVVWSVSLK